MRGWPLRAASGKKIASLADVDMKIWVQVKAMNIKEVWSQRGIKDSILGFEDLTYAF
jgi:hypothetical protein